MIKTQQVTSNKTPIHVYVVTDSTAIQFIEDNDIDGFKEYLAEEEYLDFGEPETFDTEAEAHNDSEAALKAEQMFNGDIYTMYVYLM